MEYDPIVICVYYGGSIMQDNHGYKYTHEEPHVLHENPNISYNELKRKIYSITGWSERTCELGIKARWQAGRGGHVHFMLIPIIDDNSLKSLIINTQRGHIEWSLIELYIEALSYGGGGNSMRDENIEDENIVGEEENIVVEEDGVGSEGGDSEGDHECNEARVNNESADVVIGEVGRMVEEEENRFDEAVVNNELVDLDLGDEAYPLHHEEEEEEMEVEEVPYNLSRQGLDHFRRSAPQDFLDVQIGIADHRGDFYGSRNTIGEFHKGQIFESNEHLKNAVKEWSIAHHREFLVQKSGPTVYTVKCKQHQNQNCPWI